MAADPLKKSLAAISVLLTLALVIGPAPAQIKSDVATLPFTTAPYRIGERLTYNVSFSHFMSAAHVELFVSARGTFFNREGVRLFAHVETTEIVSAALLPLNRDYISFVDPGTGLPFRTQQIMRRGEQITDTAADYNIPLGTEAIPPRQRLGEHPGTYDPVSALYRIRSLQLTEGSRYYMTVRDDLDIHNVEVRVTGKELIRTNIGSFNAIVTSIRFPRNAELNRYAVRIYFTDDEGHVPLLIVARHRAGEIRAQIVSSEILEPATSPATVAGQGTSVTPLPGPVTPLPGVTPPATDPISPGPAKPVLSGFPFNEGEQLNYRVFLGTSNQPVGSGSVQVHAVDKYFGRDGLLLTGRAQTIGQAQSLFYVNNQVSSYVDKATLVPFRSELAIHEGKRKVNDVITYDQARGTATTDKGARIEIPVGTHDMLSVLYALRSFNLTPPRRNAVSILLNNRPSTLFVTSLQRDVIELGDQKVPAIQVSLTTDHQQGDRFALRLWVSDDDRRLPLRITAISPAGPIRADLAITPVTRQ